MKPARMNIRISGEKALESVIARRLAALYRSLCSSMRCASASSRA